MNNHALLGLIAILSLSACNAGIKFSSGEKLNGEGVTFLVPTETSNSSFGTGGIKYKSASVKAETDGKTLEVNGVSYGAVARGDTVDLRSPGKVLVNGDERLPADSGKADRNTISETEARRLAADFINLELKDRQYVDIRGTSHPYPKFEPTSWRTAQVVEGRWVLTFDPPAGVHAKVSLAGSGGSLKLESCGFSPE